MALWSKRGLTIHNRVIIARSLIIPIVSYALSAASTNPRAVNVLEQQINRFLWDDPDGKKKKPLVDRATLTLPKDRGGLNCPLLRDVADARRLALWFRALYSREDWACALKQQVLSSMGKKGCAFLRKRYKGNTQSEQIINALKRLRWCYPEGDIPPEMEEFVPLLRRTGHIACKDDSWPDPPAPAPQCINNNLLNNPHFMWRHPPFPPDVMNWCSSTITVKKL